MASKRTNPIPNPAILLPQNNLNKNRIDYSQSLAPFPSKKNTKPAVNRKKMLSPCSKEEGNIINHTKIDRSIQCTLQSVVPLFKQTKTGMKCISTYDNNTNKNSSTRIISNLNIYNNNKTKSTIKLSTKPPNSSAFDNDEFIPDDLIDNNFELYYIRSDLPIRINYSSSNISRDIEWVSKTYPDDLDFNFWLPNFFEGLKLKNEPFCYLAFAGLTFILPFSGKKALDCLPEILEQLTSVLESKDEKVAVAGMRSLQLLVKTDQSIGENLVESFSKLLPYISCYKAKNTNIGDAIEYGQNQKDYVNMGEIANQTIIELVENCGPKAYPAILKAIPTFQYKKE